MTQALRQGLLALALLLPSFSSLAQPPEAVLKSAYIYQFLQHITWPDEKKRTQDLQLVYIGEEQAPLWNSLKNINQKSVRKLKIQVSQKASYNQSIIADVIVVSEKQNENVSAIYSQIKSKPVLLITNFYDDHSKIGVNFAQTPENKLSFEVNRYNLIYQQLEVSKDIVILGGTEIDIAELVKEMEASMEKARSELREQKQKLKKVEENVIKKQKQLDNQTVKLGQLDSQITQYKDQYETLKTSYEEISQSLITSRRELDSNNQLLKVRQQDVESKTTEILELSELINRNKQLLIEQAKRVENQKKELADSQKKIDEQEQTLDAKNIIIRNQTTALYGSIVLILSVGFTIILIYRNAKLKQKTNLKLEQKNRQLEKVNQELNDTQSQLVASEKMAALGGLVAGVAHEINTPVGVSVTSSTHITDTIKTFKENYAQGKLKRSELENLIENLEESSEILNRNLVRASELIRSFKQVSADQTTDEKREFTINTYLGEITQNLQHKLKQKKHEVQVVCDEFVHILSFPGIFAQIITNLIVNSVIHGFGEKERGEIKIEVAQQEDSITLDYYDDGKGIPEEIISKVFDPFFTTNRSNGGTGLGLHICYNLINQKLKGQIACIPSESGAHFQITLPKTIE